RWCDRLGRQNERACIGKMERRTGRRRLNGSCCLSGSRCCLSRRRCYLSRRRCCRLSGLSLKRGQWRRHQHLIAQSLISTSNLSKDLIYFSAQFFACQLVPVGMEIFCEFVVRIVELFSARLRRQPEQMVRVTFSDQYLERVYTAPQGYLVDT